MLKFAATVLAGVCDPQRDFLGHVGGDDFLVLFQRADWRERAADAIARFNEGAQLFTQADRQAGGLHGEDRHGNPAFFGFVTMAIGAVGVAAGAHGAKRYGSDEIAVGRRAREAARETAAGWGRGRRPRCGPRARCAIAANRRPWQSAERRAIAACRHGGARCGDGARSPARQPDR